ncbi:hypothetical protein K0U91_01560 [Chryseobacterium chendengshani]|uniref:DUF6705 family protein n=1 Tax=Chryseobacterium sp. LJ668 TaxID=2864040 RepID=UPI001C687E73|nr:DUF6705 family protein [Chryseobacterium sp. LJ668]MBW8523913.1 hypothetical protein [Chryseobacterium sp. LJ668]QYK16853.1 hypothetical protein K0U91_01560 [Chryseobacterium sp. LJ668]
MNKTQSKILVSLALIINLMSCKAQQTYPLLTSLDNIPNMSHLKDTNNELQSFVGTYVSTYNGNQTTLYISKENDKFFNYGDQQIYRDVISIKYIVKNSIGTILQDTKNMVLQQDDLSHAIYSLWVSENGTKAELVYSGTNCSVGWGDIFLKKINSTQISWEYRPDDLVTTADKCPSTLDTTIYLPATKDLIFTKQ